MAGQLDRRRLRTRPPGGAPARMAARRAGAGALAWHAARPGAGARRGHGRRRPRRRDRAARTLPAAPAARDAARRRSWPRRTIRSCRGLHQSGNSIVGDTLILSDEETVELLALFREEVATAAENAAVIEFLGRLAHRATVLVHQNVTPQDLGLIRRIVELEAPAHVEVRVATATWPLLVGIASLVGVDTYLGPPQPRRPVRADVSTVGAGDFVLGPIALDPRRQRRRGRRAGSRAPDRGCRPRFRRQGWRELRARRIPPRVPGGPQHH